MKKAVEIIRNIEQNKKNLEFMPTGFTRLDYELDGGFLKRELIIIGAFTGIGKSMMGGQIMYQIATKGFKCAYFSLEISNEMIVSRLIGQISNIKPTRIVADTIELEEIDDKAKAQAKVTMFNEFMDFYDDLYLLGELVDSIKKNKYEFVVIDFIQNVQLGNNMDEYARLTFISIQLQKIAKETNCCILILSQVSNRVNREGVKNVEYKGSGAIAMIADLGFMLQRDETIIDGRQRVKMNLLKNRRGISGLEFNFEFHLPGGLITEI